MLLALRVLGVLLWLSAVAPCIALAQVATEKVAVAPRLLIELGVVGELDPAGRTALTELLDAELAPAKLQLRSVIVARTWPGWLTSRDNPSVLMRVRLDVRDPQQWQVEIGDVARGRSLRRQLPGSASNAAAIEGAASVMTAAALALREGFELSAVEPGYKQEPAPSAGNASVAQPRPAQAARALRVVSNLAFETASFEQNVPLQAGLSLALGLRFRDLVSARLLAVQYWPAEFETTLGAFRVDRRAVGVSLGLVASTRPLELELELGSALELLRRPASAPVAGVAASDDSQQLRLGVTTAARARYRIFSLAALELRLGGAYYPTPIRYVAGTPEILVLSQPWPWVLQAGVGIELRAP